VVHSFTSLKDSLLTAKYSFLNIVVHDIHTINKRRIRTANFEASWKDKAPSEVIIFEILRLMEEFVSLCILLSR